MGKFVGEDNLRRVKEAVDLVEIMGDYAPPQKAGGQFKVCCPFHQERTPSCYLYPDQQTYHCFGCGAHGDVITLVREQEGLDFIDAVEYLARRAGVEVSYEERGSSEARGPGKSERERLLACMAFAQDFYQRQLWSAPEAAEARDYLEGRGIDRALAEQFQLGWAPGRGALCAAARGRGFTPQQLLACNVAADRDGRLIDRFYERVLFPICDRFGQPLAFSGRILPAAEQRAKEAGRGVGKYINSSDTPLYHKSEVVWNLHQARAAARKESRLLVMEGPTDVIAAAKAGFAACVAVLGTALTPAHARQMANVLGGKGSVIMLFDGDRAGQENGLKALATCIASGVPARVATMPEGHDPAELLSAGGRSALEAVLANDRCDIDHLLHSVAPLPHAMEPRARVAAIDRCLQVLQPVRDEELRRAYIEDVAAWFQMEESRLRRRLAGGERSLAVAADTPDTPELAAQEDVLLHLLVRYPALRCQAFDDLELEPGDFPAPWSQLLDLLVARPELPPPDLLAQEEVREDAALSAAVHRWLRDEQGKGALSLTEPERLLHDNVQFVKRSQLERTIAQHKQALEQAQRAGDHGQAMNLLRQVSELHTRLKTLAQH